MFDKSYGVCGDCLGEMHLMEEESIDSIVTDPPYGLEFMGKDWDHGIPGTPFWVEALRVLKPGGYLLAFGGTRTFHRLACAIEDAGFEIRDCIGWIYGSGFPKSANVSKNLDKMAGVEREIVGTNPNHRPVSGVDYEGVYAGGNTGGPNITAPASKEAKQWDGWGTALKPAWEPVIVARKPLIGTVAANVLKYGTGAINIDGCRVEAASRPLRVAEDHALSRGTYEGGAATKGGSRACGETSLGRWPANICHDGSEEVLACFPQSGSKKVRIEKNSGRTDESQYRIKPTPGTVKDFGDDGNAARFFYCAKASKKERDAGCGDLEEKNWWEKGESVSSGNAVARPGSVNLTAKSGVRQAHPSRNTHPTVKPLALMRYLCKLVTQPGGIILDPFMGSGSTGVAAHLEGFEFIGIEKEEAYIEIAKARITKVREDLEKNEGKDV